MVLGWRRFEEWQKRPRALGHARAWPGLANKPWLQLASQGNGANHLARNLLARFVISRWPPPKRCPSAIQRVFVLGTCTDPPPPVLEEIVVILSSIWVTTTITVAPESVTDEPAEGAKRSWRECPRLSTAAAIAAMTPSTVRSRSSPAFQTADQAGEWPYATVRRCLDHLRRPNGV